MATMSESFTRMREDFDRAHQGRRQLIRDLQAEVQNHAAQTAQQLADESEARQAEFAATMDNLRARSTARLPAPAGRWPSSPPICIRAERYFTAARLARRRSDNVIPTV